MCKRYARRPATDQALTDPVWYGFLSDAPAEVYPRLFSCFPDLGFTAPALLVTADAGRTYTFGLDAAGDRLFPFGHVEIYPSLTAIPDDPLIPNEDFLMEGGRIRMLNNRPRTFPAGPYWRGALVPDATIDAANPPQLYPKSARLLLVWKALEAWASRPGSGADPRYYADRYQKHEDALFLQLGTAYNQQSANGRSWYSGFDLASSGQLNV